MTADDTVSYLENMGISKICGSVIAKWDDDIGFQNIVNSNNIALKLKELYGGIGVEYCYNNQFALRGGYHYENEYRGNRKYFTLGTGFKMSVFSLDAAYLISTSQSNPLDQTLRFSLAFDMDGIKDIFQRR